MKERGTNLQEKKEEKKIVRKPEKVWVFEGAVE